MIGGWALGFVPASFLSFMLVGGALGVADIAVPFVEVWVSASRSSCSVLVVAMRWKAPVAVAMALAAVFAIFHGHAHGAEMPVDASGASYALASLRPRPRFMPPVLLPARSCPLIDSRVARPAVLAMVAAGPGLRRDGSDFFPASLSGGPCTLRGPVFSW